MPIKRGTVKYEPQAEVDHEHAEGSGVAVSSPRRVRQLRMVSIMAFSSTRFAHPRGRAAASALATALKEGLVSIPEEIELRLKPPTSYQVLSYLGYVTGIIGTAIWGYGDLLLPLAH